MKAEIRLDAPLDEGKVRQLRLGDTVRLYGNLVVMGGVPTFQRAIEYLDKGQALPANLENGVVVNCPNYTRKKGDGYDILYVNVTSSMRFESQIPKLIRQCRVRAIMGKGGLGRESVSVMKEVGCVYLALLGAGGPLLYPGLKEVTAVHWSDLDVQNRLTVVRAEGFGLATVAMDAHGNSLYDQIAAKAAKNLPGILQGLSRDRPDFSASGGLQPAIRREQVPRKGDSRSSSR